jgi:RNA polymerase sigma factor (sigma-70 family)
MSTSVPPRSRRPYVAAVLLGTALTALSAPPVSAAGAPPQAVSDIGRYCTSCWRNARLPADAWGDCTQEVFRRMLERVPASRWDLALHNEGDERREFLRAIDAVKKRTQRAKRFSGDVESAPDHRPAEESRLSEERETVQKAANAVLSARQQRIMQLSFDGWTVQQIGQELSLPVERVSDEKYKAVRRLRDHLSQREA